MHTINESNFSIIDDIENNKIASKEDLEKLFNESDFKNRFNGDNVKIFIDTCKCTKEDMNKYIKG